MSIAARKKTEPTPAPPPLSLEERLAAAKATVARLQKLETETACEAAAADASGVERTTETLEMSTVRQAADLLLAGADILDAPDPPRNRMMILDERLAAIREALRIALQRWHRLMDSRQEEVEREFLPVWREHLRKVAAMVDGLLELAAERHALIERWGERTGFRPQPIGSYEADMILGLDCFDPAHITAETRVAMLFDAAKRAGVR